MNGRRALRAGVMLGLTLAGLPLVAQTMVFKWIDARGTLHVTDRLADVPEPYYSMYRAKLRETEEQRAKAGVAPRPAPSPPPTPPPVEGGTPESQVLSPVELELKNRADWKALVARWRGELAQATAEVESIQTELDQASLNPILRETPEVKAQLADIEARRLAAMTRLEAAKKMLLVELPARAKKESVSPKWLE